MSAREVDASAPKAKAGMVRRARGSLENKLGKMNILRAGSSSSSGSFKRGGSSIGVGYESEAGSNEVPRNASAKATKLLGLDDCDTKPPRPTMQSQLAERFLSRRDRRRFSRPENDIPPMQSLAEDGDFDLNENTQSLHLGSGRAIRGKDGKPWGYMHIRRETLKVYDKPSSFCSPEEDELPVVLGKAILKEKLCDVEIVGKGDVKVSAPGFLLAAHSEVFEKKLYPGSADEGPNVRQSDGDESSLPQSPESRVVDMRLACEEAVRGTLHYLATHNLPGSFEECTESNIRSLVQINAYARLFRLNGLSSLSDQTARRLMNKTPSYVCAALDELVALNAVQVGSDSLINNINEFVVEYLRERPVESCLQGGVKYLSPEAIERVLSDQDMDVTEVAMFQVLNSWVNNAPGDMDMKIEKGKALSSHIQLFLLPRSFLDNQVRRSKFIESVMVDTALAQIEDQLINSSPEEHERVVVQGAGSDEVNGIYLRVDEDIGLGDEELVYIKEDELGSDLGLYLWRNEWYISPCVDYSRVLYKCPANVDGKTERERVAVPASGWKAVDAQSPGPSCEWKPSKLDEENTSGEMQKFLAPRLTMTPASLLKSLAGVDLSELDYAENKNALSLESMMNLPTDDNFDEDDYRVTRPTLSRTEMAAAAINKSILPAHMEEDIS